ncbi:nuclear transport factor 2 [Clonorchis sinensis]|uniref:Nuclear transport factor 2 n=1 Tax=Clonorchis sinensis TaxID=79923 RepID=G7YU02_CLOSI|nr:nuclear transport factor 2 [Clonorchis sinensis]
MQAVQPSADEIGKQFAAQYYQTLQTSRPAIRNFYHEQARMIYEGDEVVGRENIAQKLQNIKCNTLQFALSSVDAQPCGNAILILVCGQLQIQMVTRHISCRRFQLLQFRSAKNETAGKIHRWHISWEKFHAAARIPRRCCGVDVIDNKAKQKRRG